MLPDGHYSYGLSERFRVYGQDGSWRLRVGTWLLSLKDTRKVGLLYSERNGYARVLRIGTYALVLKKLPR